MLAYSLSCSGTAKCEHTVASKLRRNQMTHQGKTKWLAKYMIAVFTLLSIYPAYAQADSTFSQMKKDIETGWDEVLWSESYGLGDAAVLTGCLFYGCAQTYLGYKWDRLASKVGKDFLEQVLRNKGKVLFGPGELEVQAGDAYWSVYHRVWNPLSRRHVKITTERYVRLYVRYRRKHSTPPSVPTVDVVNVMPRFRAVNDISGHLGFDAGFPNFHQADYGNGLLYGTTLIKPGYADAVAISADELGNPGNVEERFRAVNDYAKQHGYAGGFPNFHQADYGNGLLYGTTLIKPEAATHRIISATDLIGVTEGKLR